MFDSILRQRNFKETAERGGVRRNKGWGTMWKIDSARNVPLVYFFIVCLLKFGLGVGGFPCGMIENLHGDIDSRGWAIFQKSSRVARNHNRILRRYQHSLLDPALDLTRHLAGSKG